MLTVQAVQTAAFGMVVAGFLAFANWTPERVRPPGQLAPREPSQYLIDAKAPITVGAHLLEPRAHYRITARVLSRERYWLDAASAFSPIDLAVGWGAMSDTAVIKKLDISQGGRFFYWRYQRQPPVKPSVIVESSANMHLIAASKEIERVLFRARPGDVITLAGYLVDVRKRDHIVMRTSLTRSDDGGGACEILYVTTATIEK
jgi:hypothetical protein